MSRRRIHELARKGVDKTDNHRYHVRLLKHERPVRAFEHLCRIIVLECSCKKRLSNPVHNDGSKKSMTSDIADRKHDPFVGQLIDVVPIAPDEQMVSRRTLHRVERQIRNRRQRVAGERLLEQSCNSSMASARHTCENECVR